MLEKLPVKVGSKYARIEKISQLNLICFLAAYSPIAAPIENTKSCIYFYSATRGKTLKSSSDPLASLQRTSRLTGPKSDFFSECDTTNQPKLTIRTKIQYRLLLRRNWWEKLVKVAANDWQFVH